MKLLHNQRGSSSILVVLAFLMLGIFSVLGMMSSYSGYRLAQKNAEWAREYYTLEGQAQYFTAKMDGLLLESRGAGIATLEEAIMESEPQAVMEESGGGLLVSNTFTAESGKMLELKIELLPGSEKRYRVIARKEVPQTFEYAEEPDFGDVEVIAP
ncbi:MAG TPA: hypothetical protein VN549_04675 [Negativicutes bacterium]|nr:hypothetical protein [Negativicutes bacterium]